MKRFGISIKPGMRSFRNFRESRRSFKRS